MANCQNMELEVMNKKFRFLFEHSYTDPQAVALVTYSSELPQVLLKPVRCVDYNRLWDRSKWKAIWMWTLECELRSDLNEFEHFLKGNLDWILIQVGSNR